MELHIWGGNWGLPSIDFSCLQVMTLIKFSGAEVEIRKTNNPFKTPHGYLPVFKQNQKKLMKFQDILTYLIDKNFCPDLNLPPKQLSESLAYRNMVEEKLVPALRYIWWVDSKNYVEVTRPWYAKSLTFPLNYYYPGRYKQENEIIIHSLYQNIEEPDIQTEIYKEAEKCLTCLSSRLGDSDFFYGSHPSSLDATVYGCLAPLLKAPFPSNVLQNYLKASTNLVRFIVRITQRYYPRDLQEFENKKQRQTESNSKKSDIFPNKTRNQVLAIIFALGAMLTYGISTGIFSLSISSAENENIEFDDDDQSD